TSNGFMATATASGDLRGLPDAEADAQAERVVLPRDGAPQRSRVTGADHASGNTRAGITGHYDAGALHTAAMAQVPGQQQAALDIVEYEGIVAPAREVEVAPRLDGLLSKINFTAGQLVKKGDLLFEFASKSNELARARAQANLKQAEAQLGLAEVNLKNKQALRARNVGSEMELLETQAQREIASTKVEQARANAGGAEIAPQQMKLYAPISGIVSRPFIKEGAYITKEARDQSRLATVVQLDPIYVIGQAPAAIYFQRVGGVLKTLEQT